MPEKKKFAPLLSDIRAVCSRLADPTQAARYARFFREGYDAYGVHEDDPLWQEKKKSWVEENRRRGLSWFLDLGNLLFQSGKYEEGMLAIHFASQFRGEFEPATFARLGKWYDSGLPSWAHSDVLCRDLLEPLLAGGAVGLEAMADWRSSPFKFKRRAVPVAMLGLLKTTSGVGPLLEFLRPLMCDPVREVQQGLGWFLREAWKIQPKPIEAFLLEWKDRSPRLIYQYATEKMTPAARERFSRTRGSGAASGA